MATTGAFLRCTFAGSVSVKGIRRWTFEDDSDQLDDADAETVGYKSTGAGLCGGILTIEGIHDRIVDGAFPVIRHGHAVTSVQAYRHSEDSTPAVNMPTARTFGNMEATEVNGQITYRFQVKNTGSFFLDGVEARGTG